MPRLSRWIAALALADVACDDGPRPDLARLYRVAAIDAAGRGCWPMRCCVARAHEGHHRVHVVEGEVDACEAARQCCAASANGHPRRCRAAPAATASPKRRSSPAPAPGRG
jgi:hypothetical protein